MSSSKRLSSKAVTTFTLKDASTPAPSAVPTTINTENTPLLSGTSVVPPPTSAPAPSRKRKAAAPSIPTSAPAPSRKRKAAAPSIPTPASEDDEAEPSPRSGKKVKEESESDSESAADEEVADKRRGKSKKAKKAVKAEDNGTEDEEEDSAKPAPAKKKAAKKPRAKPAPRRLGPFPPSQGPPLPDLPEDCWKEIFTFLSSPLDIARLTVGGGSHLYDIAPHDGDAWAGALARRFPKGVELLPNESPAAGYCALVDKLCRLCYRPLHTSRKALSFYFPPSGTSDAPQPQWLEDMKETRPKKGKGKTSKAKAATKADEVAAAAAAEAAAIAAGAEAARLRIADIRTRLRPIVESRGANLYAGAGAAGAGAAGGVTAVPAPAPVSGVEAFVRERDAPQAARGKVAARFAAERRVSWFLEREDDQSASFSSASGGYSYGQVGLQRAFTLDRYKDKVEEADRIKAAEVAEQQKIAAREASRAAALGIVSATGAGAGAGGRGADDAAAGGRGVIHQPHVRMRSGLPWRGATPSVSPPAIVCDKCRTKKHLVMGHLKAEREWGLSTHTVLSSQIPLAESAARFNALSGRLAPGNRYAFTRDVEALSIVRK